MIKSAGLFLDQNGYIVAGVFFMGTRASGHPQGMPLQFKEHVEMKDVANQLYKATTA